MPQYVECLSICDVQVCFSDKLEYFENNFTADYLKVSAQADPNMGDQLILFNSKAVLSQ